MRDKIIEAVVNAICEIERAGGQDAIVGPSRKALPHLAGTEQARAEYARCIRAALAAIEDAGYRIVPVEPTAEMMSEISGVMIGSYDAREAYLAMLAVAPKVTP